MVRRVVFRGQRRWPGRQLFARAPRPEEACTRMRTRRRCGRTPPPHESLHGHHVGFANWPVAAATVTLLEQGMGTTTAVKTLWGPGREQGFPVTGQYSYPLLHGGARVVWLRTFIIFISLYYYDKDESIDSDCSDDGFMDNI